MGVIKTLAKVAVGSAVTKKALDAAYDKLSNSDSQINRRSVISTCYNCGKTIDATVKFCPYCGASINAADYKYSEGFAEYEQVNHVGDLDTKGTYGNTSNEDHFRKQNSEWKTFVCPNCGSMMDSVTNKCPNCDFEVYDDAPSSAKANEYNFEKQNTGQKTSVCPNCGGMMDSFTNKCPYCGYEVYDDAPSSVKDLTNRLSSIESRRFVWHPRQMSALEGAIGMVLGKEDKEEEQRQKAIEAFEKQKLNEKKLQILNYPVPNNQAEIMEFMLLVLSNINVQDGKIDEIEEAWISKMEQTYQRASLVMRGDSNFSSIKVMYEQKMNEVYSLKKRKAAAKKNKKKLTFIIIGIGILMIIFGEFCGHATGDGNSPFYTVALLGIAVAVGGFGLLTSNNNKKDED